MHRPVAVRTWQRLRRSALGALLLAVLIGAATVAPAAARQPAPPPGEETSLPPIDVVVLVDESGSLSEADVAAERRAARSIAGGILAPGSTIEVVGFGSSNGPGQNAVQVYCPKALVDTGAQRDAVATCIEGLHERTEDEGNDTDHVSALQQALATLGDGSDRPKIVFLMTDGKLDVGRTEAYGRDLGDEQATIAGRNAAALDQLDDVLGQLGGIGAQVWPLGFGQADLVELGRFPVGTSCAPGVADPAEQVISDPNQLDETILTAYQSAACVRVGPKSEGSGGAGSTVTLNVDVPTIASDASILVYKVDPRVTVEYVDPQGVVAAGAGAGGSVFQFSGQNTDTESLRIIDPQPGPWQVRLTAGPEVPDLEFAARVVYQGAVNALVSITPPQPAAGQEVEVAMQLRTRRQAITSPADLEGISFVAGLVTGGTPSDPITLADADGDGTYTGLIRVPDGATGDLTFTGTVAGPGIGGDVQELYTRVLGAPADLQGQLLIGPGSTSVAPGGELRGQAVVTNTSGEPQRLRLVVEDPTVGALIMPVPPIVEVPVGGATQDFVLQIGADSVQSPTQALLKLVVDDDPATVVAQRPLSFDVSPPPTWLERNLWWLIPLAVVLLALLAYLLWRWKAARDRRRVAGLMVELRRNGGQVAQLAPSRPRDFVFPFQIVDDETLGANLQPVQRNTPLDPTIFEVRRDGADVSLTTEGISGETLGLGEPRPVGRGLSVVVLSGTQPTGYPPSGDPGWPGGDGGGAWPDSPGWGGGSPGRSAGNQGAPVGGAGGSTWSEDQSWSDGSGAGSWDANQPTVAQPGGGQQGAAQPTAAYPNNGQPAEQSWPAAKPPATDDQWNDQSWGSGSSSDQGWR